MWIKLMGLNENRTLQNDTRVIINWGKASLNGRRQERRDTHKSSKKYRFLWSFFECTCLAEWRVFGTPIISQSLPSLWFGAFKTTSSVLGQASTSMSFYWQPSLFYKYTKQVRPHQWAPSDSTIIKISVLRVYNVNFMGSLSITSSSL